MQVNPYSEIGVFNALIDDYNQQGLYQHIYSYCDSILRLNQNDPIVSFWHAFASAQIGRHTDAIRELKPLQRESEVALAVTACLINTHKLAEVKDKEELSNLKDQMKTLSKSSGDSALVFAGRYFWHAGKEKQAKQCLEKVLAKNKRHVEALGLFGWCNLKANSRGFKSSMKLFDQAIKIDPKDVVSYMGRARCHQSKGDYQEALEDLNHIIVHHANFLPGLVAKSKVLMVMSNWDEAVNTSHRVLLADKECIGALRIICLYLLARSKSLEVTNRMNDLHTALDNKEPSNSRLYFEVSQLCARLAGKQPNILELTLEMIKQACRLEEMSSTSDNLSKYLAEQAYQLMLGGNYREATKLFDQASKLDEGNDMAVTGRIKCKLLMQYYDEAQQMLEFMSEVTSTDQSSSELLYLHAVLAKQKGEAGMEESTDLLCKAVDEHIKMLDSATPGFNYFVAYNPDFVLELATEFMTRVGTEPMSSSDPPNPVLNKVIALLNNLIDLVPGNLGGQLLLARASFVAGDFENSERCLMSCLKLDPQFAPAYIVQAQICLARENFQQCAQSLDQARALDFEVRGTPTFMLTKARFLSASGKLAEAQTMLETAMSLDGVSRKNVNRPVPPQERLAIFLELAAVHQKQEHMPEASKIMSDAKSEFEKTPDGERIIIADCDLAIGRGAYDAALASLRTIEQGSQFWVMSKIKMADIYLKYKKNEKLYASCYMEMANKSKTVHSHILLGEALMRIQQPNRAINSFKKALTIDPEDPTLASRIGRALVATHDYSRAVEYYETAAKGDPSKIYLFHELAELNLQLRKFDDAKRVLDEALHGYKRNPDDIYNCMEDVRSESIMADVHIESGASVEKVRAALMAAWTGQQRVLDMMRSVDPDQRRKQQKLAAKLCFKLAESFKRSKENDKAVSYYEETLKQDDSHIGARLALARHYLMKNDFDQCQQQCLTLTKFDPQNKEASMMLADLMFRKNEHDSATAYFKQFLEQNPTNYGAMDKLITLLKRAGRLQDAQHFIKNAEKSSAKAGYEYGLKYCKGLLAWYQNNPRQALSEFSSARNDGVWGQPAIIAMIEIYLNPDNVGLFQESTEAKGDNSHHVNAATKLLKELSPNLKQSDPMKYTVLQAYCLLSTRSKSRIDQALALFQDLWADDKDCVPACLGMANAYMLKGETPKARNQLKRVSKMKVLPEYSQEYEKSWLMLADIYINSGKYDLAQELCRKCLNNNKSCAKAYEMMGAIMEREQAYRDASENYENAWNFTNESSASIGYKLAFNYLKAKRYVEAIDVCHKVLEKHPAYPKIRESILNKARASLRP